MLALGTVPAAEEMNTLAEAGFLCEWRLVGLCHQQILLRNTSEDAFYPESRYRAYCIHRLHGFLQLMYLAGVPGGQTGDGHHSMTCTVSLVLWSWQASA